MLKDFMVVNNIFDNPDEIIDFAKKQKFLTKEEHEAGAKSRYSGLRTNSIFHIDPEMYHKINNEIFNKCTEQIYPKNFNQVEYGFGFETSLYFHTLYEDDQPDNTWWHRDVDCIWAGVIYLNKNAQPNSGTIINKNTKNILVDNEFNKLVLYHPTYMHTSEGGFGTNVDDCRLTLTFFVNAFQFKIKALAN